MTTTPALGGSPGPGTTPKHRFGMSLRSGSNIVFGAAGTATCPPHTCRLPTNQRLSPTSTVSKLGTFVVSSNEPIICTCDPTMRPSSARLGLSPSPALKIAICSRIRTRWSLRGLWNRPNRPSARRHRPGRGRPPPGNRVTAPYPSVEPRIDSLGGYKPVARLPGGHICGSDAADRFHPQTILVPPEPVSR